MELFADCLNTCLQYPAISYPSPQIPAASPVMPPEQYSAPVVNPAPFYQAPSPPSEALVSLIPTDTATQPLAPLTCPDNGQLMQLALGNPCVGQISTSDPNVLIDDKINPGAQGINFQSTVPITMTIQLNCNIQMMYMCIPGVTTNVKSFTYTLRDIYNNPVASGPINTYGSNPCNPRPVNIISVASQLMITISQTNDARPPRNVVLDLQGCYVSMLSVMPRQAASVSATPSSTTPILMQTVSPVQQTSTTPSNMCPQVALSSHPSVELISFSDGTNVTSDLDPDGNGSNLLSTGTTMTVLLRDGAPATFSSVGVSSPNVNQIDIALFDKLSNRPLIQSPEGATRSSLTLNPIVENLPSDPAATLAVTFVNTIDGQPPRNVKLLVYVCFPTVTRMFPLPAQSPSGQYPPQTNLFNPQLYAPINPPAQIYPFTNPMNFCIDPSQPAQVTSVANTALPPEYYSSNQCVCICQAGIVIPPTNGILQYYPPTRIINRRAVSKKSSNPRR